MGTHHLERMLEEFRAAYAGSREASEGLAAQVGLRGRSADWLRRLPPGVAEAVRRSAGDWGRRLEEERSDRRVVTAPVSEASGGRMSPVDFVYRTMGR